MVTSQCLALAAMTLSLTFLGGCRTHANDSFAATNLLAPLIVAEIPGVLRVEAEMMPRGEVKNDKDASGGKYVRVSGEYQPILTADVPKTGGGVFTIWARVRGIQAQLKGTPGGTQKEYEWSWDKSDTWKWVRFGRHTRAALGENIVIIRGSGAAGENDGLDCLVFAEDDSYKPDSAGNTAPDGTAFLPDFDKKPVVPTPDASRTPIAVSVNWAKVEGKATPLHYSINLYGGFSEKNALSAAYKANIEYMAPGMVRYHNAGKMQPSSKSWEGCLNESGTGWDRAKLARILTALRFKHKPAVLLNIPSFPAGMDKNNDRFLDVDQWDAYAALCADFVRIVNVENKLGVKYFEITNEWDGPYFTDFHENGGWGGLKDPNKPDRWDEVGEIYNRCAAAMKAVDPAIKTGGPAAARPDLVEMHERFARKTLPYLDFFSIHAYASGSADTPDAEVYDRAKAMGDFAKNAVTLMEKVSPTRRIPVFLDEYNISWTWETRDPRMTNAKSGVFDALTMVATTRAGLDSAQAWNEKDGVYGKTDNGDNRRPGAEVFHLFNTYLVGNRVVTKSGNGAVVAYAVTNPQTKRRSLLMINRTDASQTVNAAFTGQPTGAKGYQRVEIASGKNGEKPTTTRGTPFAKPGRASWVLPAHSVTLLTFGG
ncbi:MAG: hypothetical protein H8F28_02540 [Fibrella sp.]|nr:hypothetical protein [Armatimonadota bacterium]